MKIKAIFVAIAMAFVAAFTSQAQTQSEIDQVMQQVAHEMNTQLQGVEGINNVVYDTATHGLYINLSNSLIKLCEQSDIPRTDIKSYMIQGMIEEGDTGSFAEMLSMLNQMNVKFGVRYTYKGKRYTDLFRASDFR